MTDFPLPELFEALVFMNYPFVLSNYSITQTWRSKHWHGGMITRHHVWIVGSRKTMRALGTSLNGDQKILPKNLQDFRHSCSYILYWTWHRERHFFCFFHGMLDFENIWTDNSCCRDCSWQNSWRNQKLLWVNRRNLIK